MNFQRRQRERDNVMSCLMEGEEGGEGRICIIRAIIKI